MWKNWKEKKGRREEWGREEGRLEGRRKKETRKEKRKEVAPPPSAATFFTRTGPPFKIRGLQFRLPFCPQVARSHPWIPMKMETAEGSSWGPRPCKPAGGAADPRAVAHGARRKKPEPSPASSAHRRTLPSGLTACARTSSIACWETCRKPSREVP